MLGGAGHPERKEHVQVEKGRHFLHPRGSEGGGCSSVVERMLCMYEAPGSIPGISNFLF